jgi:hypothetical protein
MIYTYTHCITPATTILHILTNFQKLKKNILKEKDEQEYLLKEEDYFVRTLKKTDNSTANWLNIMYPKLFLAKISLKTTT